MTFTPRFPRFLHGGDYNPDQWLASPEVLDKDIELMHAAHVNCVSVGIFSWTLLEPEEGRYDFVWLDEVIDRLWAGGIHVILATPSGARPAWMAAEHPEVLRVDEQLRRHHFGERHNHCLTSPYYRKKVREMDAALARRYSRHPAVVLWHLSNEYSGDCYCPLCQQAFRDWLKAKYGTLAGLNAGWWTGFWSQRYTDWSQVEAPSPLGEMSNPSMLLDWRRFSTWQCKTFLMAERDAVKAVDPELMCTANLMERFWDYDYFSLAEGMDVVSWDAYPAWGSGDDAALAADFAMNHDLMRSLKAQPFLLMESTPSLVNWKPHNKLKRPGMHLLSSMQAVAHGSQSVMYFQWRQGRGGAEMFHGAVVDHYGEADTRVFRDVAEVGEKLERLESVYEAQPRAEVCVLFDWENRWAIDFAQAGQKGSMRYFDTVNMHYRSLWQEGVTVDFRDMRACTDLTGYRLVIAPMLFMLRGGIEKKLRDFVAGGGTLLTTYFSGVVDACNLAFTGPAPHGLTDVLGLRAAELDALCPEDHNALCLRDGRRFDVTDLCALVESRGAETLGVYGEDFYKDQPCLTVNRFGDGRAYFLAAKVSQEGLDAIYRDLIAELSLTRAWSDPLPRGVVAARRGDMIFLQNYSGSSHLLTLPLPYRDLLTNQTLDGPFNLPVNGVLALRALGNDEAGGRFPEESASRTLP